MSKPKQHAHKVGDAVEFRSGPGAPWLEARITDVSTDGHTISLRYNDVAGNPATAADVPHDPIATGPCYRLPGERT